MHIFLQRVLVWLPAGGAGWRHNWLVFHLFLFAYFLCIFLVHIFGAYFFGIFLCKGFWSACLQVVLVGAIIGSYFTLSIMAAPASSSSSWKEDASKNLHKYNFQFWRNTVSNFDRSIIFHSCPFYLILLQGAGVYVIIVILGKIIEKGSTEDKIQDPKFRRFTDTSEYHTPLLSKIWDLSDRQICERIPKNK